MSKLRRGLLVLTGTVGLAVLLTGCDTPLTLINGWTGGPFSTSTPSYSIVSGVVHFRGAISTSGTNTVPFTLPASARPATDVYVPVDLCGAANGRLHIQASGTVDVEAEGAFSSAQCFTSLDGASFPADLTSYSALTLLNGWTNAPFSTRPAEVALTDGIVSFSGAIATSGLNQVAFTLPAAFRPATACLRARRPLHLVERPLAHPARRHGRRRDREGLLERAVLHLARGCLVRTGREQPYAPDPAERLDQRAVRHQ